MQHIPRQAKGCITNYPLKTYCTQGASWQQNECSFQREQKRKEGKTAINFQDVSIFMSPVKSNKPTQHHTAVPDTAWMWSSPVKGKGCWLHGGLNPFQTVCGLKPLERDEKQKQRKEHHRSGHGCCRIFRYSNTGETSCDSAGSQYLLAVFTNTNVLLSLLKLPPCLSNLLHLHYPFRSNHCLENTVILHK